MGVLDGKESNSSAIAKTGGGGVIDVGAIAIPQFMPQNLVDVGLCNSQEELEQVKQNLNEFRKVAQFTKAKFKAQMSAADITLELVKSKNQMIKHFASTFLKQAKNDSELAALLQALPEMVGAISGTIGQKKELKVRNFAAQLSQAGQKGRK